MQRIYILHLLFLSSIIVPAQEKDNIKTLDHFFAGVPLTKDFIEWYHYIHDHPFLGIDSTGKRGFYSSFKPGIKNYFPFPDSLTVKLLLKKTVFSDSLTNKRYDSTAIIMIEGVFADNKTGRKKSREVFKEIRKNLKRYYKQEVKSLDGSGSWFKKGKSDNFPNCSLWYGYEEDRKFYYVLIGYDFPARNEEPWYFKLAS